MQQKIKCLVETFLKQFSKLQTEKRKAQIGGELIYSHSSELHVCKGGSDLKFSKSIYLDYNATTPIDPEVLKTMMPYLKESFGNPSSNHTYGEVAKEAVYEARKKVADLIGSEPNDIVFTSGGSESNNHAIIGTALANRKKGKHIITSRIEHPSVLETLHYLEEKFGFKVTYSAVDKYGVVNPSDVEKSISKETILVHLQHHTNNT